MSDVTRLPSTDLQLGSAGNAPTPSRDISDLIAIMAALRHPETGCRWDLDQDFASLAPYAVEEAYEVADAIARGDQADIQDELGDLLLQVVFQARLAQEKGWFDFGGVVEAITAKLIRRHPHIFGDARDLSPDEVKAVWDEIKQAEKREKAARHPEPAAADRPSILDGVPASLPAMARALKLTRKAAAIGFTWPDAAAVADKVDEELAEVREALPEGGAKLAEELGDLLFVVTNLARQLDIDPESALAAANRKFERRFRSVEQALADQGRSPRQSTLAEMDELWDRAKAAERAGGS